MPRIRFSPIMLSGPTLAVCGPLVAPVKSSQPPSRQAEAKVAAFKPGPQIRWEQGLEPLRQGNTAPTLASFDQAPCPGLPPELARDVQNAMTDLGPSSIVDPLIEPKHR